MSTLLFILSLLCIRSYGVTISTKLGSIEGQQTSTKSGDIYTFKGIPYAVPPLDDLRFAPSQLKTSLFHSESGTNTFDATTFGAACIQQNVSLQQTHHISEDCLFLNVWTPTLNKSANIPVMIWIHGGGDKFGAGSDTLFHGDHCGDAKTADDKKCIPFANDVVLVTMNYRLGALGWLSNKDLFHKYRSYGGLNGIGDQITAIQWVHRHIADYGGNPEDLTIFGESAGGAAVCMLMVCLLVIFAFFTFSNLAS